jgi:hypothetical protein
MYVFYEFGMYEKHNIPGVGPSAGLAPGRDTNPPSFRNCAAIEAAMVELQTLCRHIKSAFFTSSEIFCML